MYHEECYNGGKMIDVLTMVSAVFGWYRYRYLVSQFKGWACCNRHILKLCIMWRKILIGQVLLGMHVLQTLVLQNIELFDMTQERDLCSTCVANMIHSKNFRWILSSDSEFFRSPRNMCERQGQWCDPDCIRLLLSNSLNNSDHAWQVEAWARGEERKRPERQVEQSWVW